MATELENLRNKAQALFKEKKYAEIIQLLTVEVLDKHQDAPLFTWRARAHDRLKEVDSTSEYAEKAIAADSQNWMGYFVRGNSWYNKGEYDKAITDYSKAIELNPDDADTYNNRGNSWYNKGDHDKAIDDYTKAIELNPDDADTYDNRGNSWYDKGDHDKAIDDYTKAIELNPNDAKTYYARGRA